MNEEVVYYPREAVLEAVKRYKTPFFLYEEKRLRSNCRRFLGAFRKYFPDFEALFAVKANPNPDILKIVAEEGFGMDCSSESEAWISEKLGVSGVYTGNYTSEDEFAFVKDKRMLLNLDDISMLPTLVRLGVPETLSFRVNPGVGKATRESCVLAGPDAKYGVPFEKAPEAYQKAKELGVKHFGIHMMTGSNVPMDEKDYFAKIVEKLFEIVADVKEKTGVEIEFMNIGGGFCVPYHPDEESLDISAVAKSVYETFNSQCEKYGLKRPRLMAEPGRFISADAGFLITRVTVVKDSYKKFVGVDAGSNDMPRPAIYGAYHYVSVANNSSEKEVVSVVGRICENSDQFAKDRLLPVCEPGDVLIIHTCGGHAYAMGSNYNGRPRHAEYLLTLDGDLEQIRREETIEDLYKTTDYGN